ncbi:hypothetical protein L3X38_039342 [Prunus dulcis]|uniref:Uncharacterized protein n=1 Tax=Prunus dulcis TaxID=3755 RepID=A0AAD4V6W2_PRUDU|nr:hypothetical protein L3X38_039342 [Prunus dulcis]
MSESSENNFPGKQAKQTIFIPIVVYLLQTPLDFFFFFFWIDHPLCLSSESGNVNAGIWAGLWFQVCICDMSA